jgi:PAS domain S-box-containing protein
VTPSDSQLALFRRIPVLAALLNRDGCFIEVSDTWVSRTGYSRESLRGARPEDLATTDSARRIREEYRPTLRRTGRLDNVPVDFRTPSGGTLQLLVTTTTESDDAGEFVHSLSVFTEFSDQARLEKRFRALYRATPAMLHTVDPNGRLTEVSDHWLFKLGYTRDEVLGRSILEFMLDGSRQHEIMRGGDFRSVPGQMVTSSRAVRDVLLSAHTERDAEQAVVRTLVASEDVTERNRAEARPGARPFLTETQMRDQQRANLVAALEAAGWRIAGKGGAAELLGIRPSTLTDRMKSLQVRRPARGWDREQEPGRRRQGRD